MLQWLEGTIGNMIAITTVLPTLGHVAMVGFSQCVKWTGLVWTADGTLQGPGLSSITLSEASLLTAPVSPALAALGEQARS